MRGVFYLGTLVKVVVIWGMVLSLLQLSFAQVMTSSNFQIQSDSINSGGGDGTSSTYTLESTLGEVSTGEGTSTNYFLRAGYQQMHEVYLSLSGVADVVLSPSLPGITGGAATGSVAVSVMTDSQAGYQLTIASNRTPAMQTANLDTIADYVPVAGPVPDYTFTTASGEAHFGYSPEGPDIAIRFQDNAGVCGIAGGDTIDSCWDGLATSSTIIASAPTANQPSGATTTIQFQVGIGNGSSVVPGSYTATTTLTAIAL